MLGKNKKQIINRLRRIQGQVKGLEKMVDESEYCVNIITQSLAIQRSLQSFDQVLLKNHLEEHVSRQFAHGQSGKAISELLDLYYLSTKN